jgi:hypothetical protein
MGFKRYRFLVIEKNPGSSSILNARAVYLLVDSLPEIHEEKFLAKFINILTNQDLKLIIDTECLFYLNLTMQSVLFNYAETSKNIYLLEFEPQAECPFNIIRPCNCFDQDYGGVLKSLVLNFNLNVKIFVFKQSENQKLFRVLDFAAENNFEVIVLPRDFFDRKSKGNLLALKEGCFPVFDFEELIELLSS